MSDKKIFIDVETAGLDTSRCGMFQVAGIVDINGETKEEFDFQCGLFQDDLVEEKSFEKTGLSIKEISQFPNPTGIFKTFINTLSKYIDRYDKNDKFIALAYFADFDNQVLRSWFKKNKDDFFGSWFHHPFLDIAQLVAFVYQQDRNLFPNFKLQTVAYMMGITESDNPKEFHDALYDVRITREIYYKVNSMLIGEN